MISAGDISDMKGGPDTNPGHSIWSRRSAHLIELILKSRSVRCRQEIKLVLVGTVRVQEQPVVGSNAGLAVFRPEGECDLVQRIAFRAFFQRIVVVYGGGHCLAEQDPVGRFVGDMECKARPGKDRLGLGPCFRQAQAGENGRLVFRREAGDAACGLTGGQEDSGACGQDEFSQHLGFLCAGWFHFRRRRNRGSDRSRPAGMPAAGQGSLEGLRGLAPT
jgi:hypothetical protein